MARNTRLSALSILFSLVAACAGSSSSSGTSPAVVTDTLGVQFSVSCSGLYCSLTSNDPNVVPTSCDGANGTDTFVLVWARILTVHVLNVPTSGTIQVNADGSNAHRIGAPSGALDDQHWADFAWS